MKKSILPPFILGLALSLPSCMIIKEKDDEKIKPQKNKCNIEEIRFVVDTSIGVPAGLYDRTLFFNTKGEPSKLVVDNPQTGNASQLFVYNTKGWFTKWIYYFGDSPSDLDAPVESNNIFTAHLYEHDNKGNIIRDSFFVSMGTPIHSFQYNGNVTTYSYDHKNRIVATRFMDQWSPDLIRKEYYSYNTQGNLESVAMYYSSSGGESLHGIYNYTYDNNPSTIAMSKTLMFLNRNYSKNNMASFFIDPTVYPFAETYAMTYNAQGLMASKNQNLSPVEGYSVGTSYIKYNCK